MKESKQRPLQLILDKHDKDGFLDKNHKETLESQQTGKNGQHGLNLNRSYIKFNESSPFLSNLVHD